MKPTLSKSQYLKGLQCPKALWFYRHRKDLQPPIDSATQARFDAGNQIGQLAMQYFDEGVEVTDEYWAIEKAAHTTQDYIAQGNQVIFEATAIHPENGCYSRIDALRKVPNSDEWDLIEVKSSTSVRQYHIDDMSFSILCFFSSRL